MSKNELCCHKCGGFPGSTSKPRAKLIKCHECGALTCNLHVLGGKCPACKGSRVSTASTTAGFKKATQRQRPKPKLLGARVGGGGGDRSVKKGEKVNNPLAAAGATILRAGANALVSHLLADYGGEGDAPSSNMVENNRSQLANVQRRTALPQNQMPGESKVEADIEKGAEALENKVDKSLSVYGVDNHLSHQEVQELEEEIALRQVDKAAWHKVLVDSSFRVGSLEGLQRFQKNWEGMKESKWQRIALLNAELTSVDFLTAFSKVVHNTKWVYGAIGYGPKKAPEYLRSLDFDVMTKAIQHAPEIIALGEIGLDLHFAPYTENEQIELFKKQLIFAAESGLTILMTCKKAVKQQAAALADVRVSHDLPPIIYTGLIEDDETREMCLENDCFVVIRPEITYDDQEAYRENLKAFLPERRLLAGGDELKPPKDHVGDYNSPAYLDLTVRAAVALFGEIEDKFIKQTGENFKEVFPYIFIEPENTD